MTKFPPFPPAPKGLFETDNGRILCGAHLGATARATRRDISGQPIRRISAADLAALAVEIGHPVGCETCGAQS